MASDPFYALHDLFCFAIASDNQLLDVMEDYVRLDMDHESLNNENPSLSNLVYYRELLENYMRRLYENTEVVRRRGGTKWPHISEQEKKLHAKVVSAAEALLRDCEYLQRRADSICKRCERGMTVIMNNRTLAESKRGISQANAVARLTFIAFVYIPLSFTTSFFGMNISELDSGPTPMWIWAAASIPALSTTVVLFFLDLQRVTNSCQSLLTRVGTVYRSRSSGIKTV